MLTGVPSRCRAQVRDAVHRFLGGDVPHSALDEKRLTDHEKVVRRLNALNIMAL